MATLDIKTMSKAEKLQAMEALWDSLIHGDSEVESPEWHQDLLADRKQKIADGKVEYMSIEELKAKHR